MRPATTSATPTEIDPTTDPTAIVHPLGADPNSSPTPSAHPSMAATTPVAPHARGRLGSRSRWAALLLPILVAGAAWRLTDTPSDDASTSRPRPPVTTTGAAPATTVRPTLVPASATPTTLHGGGTWNGSGSGSTGGSSGGTQGGQQGGGDEAPPVAPDPALLSVPGSVNLSGAGHGTITVTNAGGSRLQFTAAAPPEASLGLDGGVLAAGESVDIPVTVDDSQFPSGAYVVAVTLLSDGGDAEVELHGFVLDGLAPNPPTTKPGPPVADVPWAPFELD